MQIDESRGVIQGKKMAFIAVFLNLFWIVAYCFIGLVFLPAMKTQQFRVQAIEAHTLLKGLDVAQEEFRANYGAYAPLRVTPSKAGGTKTQVWDAKPCPKDCRPGNAAACVEFTCLNYEPLSLTVRFQYGCKVDSYSTYVSCGARSDLDGDGTYESLTYRKGPSGTTTSTLSDGLSKCDPAKPVITNTVFPCNIQHL